MDEVQRAVGQLAEFKTWLNTQSIRATFRTPDDLGFRGVPNHPVVNVSWHEALRYCEWLTITLREWSDAPPAVAQWLDATVRAGWVITLPSEAEWEKAARGTAGSEYPWKGKFDPDKANTNETGIGRTSPVGAFPRRKSPYHAHDMSGNVWEWTRSLWDEDVMKPRFAYPHIATDGREDLTAPDSVRRVVRGGSFVFSSDFARAASRDWSRPVDRDYGFWFRVVVSRSRS